MFYVKAALEACSDIRVVLTFAVSLQVRVDVLSYRRSREDADLLPGLALFSRGVRQRLHPAAGRRSKQTSQIPQSAALPIQVSKHSRRHHRGSHCPEMPCPPCLFSPPGLWTCRRTAARSTSTISTRAPSRCWRMPRSTAHWSAGTCAPAPTPGRSATTSASASSRPSASTCTSAGFASVSVRLCVFS